MRQPVEHSDLLKFHFLAAPSLSPDGKRAAYRVSRADAEKNGYRSDIWICDLGSGDSRRLTASGREEFLCWSRDGQRIIFASGRGGHRHPRAGQSPVTRFYSIRFDGGEAEFLFEIPHKASAVQALDEDRFLITAAFEPTWDNPEEASYMVFEQVPFMANGQGYVGQRRMGLGVYDLKSGEFRRLTPPALDVGRAALNEDRTKALVVGWDYKDVKPMNNGVYELDLVLEDFRPLSAGLHYTFKHAAWDDEAIIVTATDRRTAGVNENPKVYLLEGGRMNCLTPELDSSLTHAVVMDTAYGCADREGAVVSSEMGLVCCATEGFKSRLYAITPEGRLRVLTPGVSSVIDYDVKGARAVYIACEGLRLPELYLLEGGTERRLTSFNDAFFEGRVLAQPIHITFKGGDGEELDGWYMRPPDFREGERRPAILHVHGGPKAAFGDVYHHEMQYWAARGYAVVYCNPRGSDGRGNSFSDIRGKYGDADYRDLMTFMDWCVKNLNFVDASRLGVTGGSYGGYMVNWIITQTNRFRAAVSQRGIANWVSKFGGCDIGYYYVEDQHLGTPWGKPERAWMESPLAHAGQARTPTLFVHSTEDFRCELNQGFQMFTALKVNGVEARMCVFKGENHELSRSGKPRNRLARLRVIREWFDAHIKR